MAQENQKPELPGTQRFSASRRRALRYWLGGLVLLSGVVLFATHLGDIDRFAMLLSQVEAAWLLAGFFLQAATYLCTAAAWHQALTRLGVVYSFLPLVHLSVAKLYLDQVLPSGGISGTMFMVSAMNRRGVSREQCMSAVMVSLTGYYMAYVLAVLTTILILEYYKDLSIWVLTASVFLCAFAVLMPIGILWLARRGRKPPAFLARLPGIYFFVEAISRNPGILLRSPVLVAKVTMFAASVFLLDAATLWIMLRALGQDVSFTVAFPSFVVASMVMTLGPVPLGLGTFEAACVTMLGTLGVQIEAALTSTLLLRGFTMWLPMLPGFWLARRELSRGPGHGDAN